MTVEEHKAWTALKERQLEASSSAPRRRELFRFGRKSPETPGGGRLFFAGPTAVTCVIHPQAACRILAPYTLRFLQSDRHPFDPRRIQICLSSCFSLTKSPIITVITMFGSRNTRPEPGRQPPQSSQRGSYGRAPSDSSDRYGGGYGGGYARAPARYDGPSEKHDHRSGHAQSWSLQPVKSPTVAITYGNTVAVSPFDFQQIQGELYLILNDIFVVTARPLDNFPQGQISLSDFQRTWAQISLQDTVQARVYNPFDEGGHRYLGSIDADVGLAGRKATDAPFDSDELGRVFLKVGISSIHSKLC